MLILLSFILVADQNQCLLIVIQDDHGEQAARLRETHIIAGRYHPRFGSVADHESCQVSPADVAVAHLLTHFAEGQRGQEGTGRRDDHGEKDALHAPVRPLRRWHDQRHDQEECAEANRTFTRKRAWNAFHFSSATKPLQIYSMERENMTVVEAYKAHPYMKRRNQLSV